MTSTKNIPVYLPVLVVSVLISLLAGCNKYEPVTDLSNPAYLRVYNNIPFVQDVLHKDLPHPFLTFLVDPKLDKDGIPYDAEIVGDYLNARQLYSISYPINAGNVFQKMNYDWPGNAPVLTAPPLNGLDLSAWAQISSGNHRIMFVVRPFSDTTAFVRLSAQERSKVLIDTTIDLTSGEVYTMEAVLKDFDQRKYSAYVRKEAFIHENFETDKSYLSIYNLSGNRSLNIPSTSLPQYFAADTMKLSYSYMQLDDLTSIPSNYQYIPVLPYTNIPMGSIDKRFQGSAPFVPIPMLSPALYYKPDGVFREYGYHIRSGFNNYFLGTMPFIAFTAVDQSGNLLKPEDGRFASIYACADPANVNEYNMIGINGYVNAPPAVTANLTWISNMDGNTEFNSSINIFELVYDRVFHIQVTRLAPNAPGR